MKRYALLLIIIALILLTFTACADNGVTSTESESPTSTAETTSISTSEIPTESVAGESKPTTNQNDTTVESSIAVQSTQKQTTQSQQKPKDDKSVTSSKSSTSSASSKSQDNSKPKESPVPKSAFAKPFDIATMKSELIDYGNSIGMTHITNFSSDFGGGQITPEGTTWLPPHETWMYDSSSAGKLKQDLCDRIKRWKNNGESTYTLWFEKDSNHSGDYIIYVIIG